MIRFETAFEGRPDAVETLVPALGGDGRWRVAGYFIKVAARPYVPAGGWLALCRPAAISGMIPSLT